MTRFFPIIAHARSGSTLLCNEVKKHASGAVLLEIFHQLPDVIERHLGRFSSDVFATLGVDKTTVRDYVVNNQLEYLEAIQGVTGRDEIIFKIFPFHLPRERIRPVLANAAGVIILRRNLLHSYISNKIASSSGRYVRSSTSKAKVAFDPGDFSTYVRSMYGFRRRAVAYLEARGDGVRHRMVDYESLVDPQMRERAVAEGLAYVGAGVGATEPARPMVKQDSRRLASDKVENPQEMTEVLDYLGLAGADDGAFSPSEDDYRQALERAEAAWGEAAKGPATATH